MNLVRRIGLSALAALIGGAGVALAQEGALRVQVRAADDASALVVEDVLLYRASHALVIGIDNYSNGWPRLSMAVQDAKIVAEELARHGFEVTLKTDLKSTELRETLEEFFIVKGQHPEARLLFWFAGHGHTEHGEGFLVPSDAPRADIATRFMLSALPMRRFGEYVRLARSKHVFAVFDSCFSGTIFDAQRSLPPRAITQATKLPVRQFLTSGDADQTVFDNGTFRELFLRALRGEDGADANRDGFVTASEIGLYLTDRITNLTRSRQTPRYGKLLDKDLDRGDFVFKTRLAAAAPQAAAAPTQTRPATRAPSADDRAYELAFWDAIKNSTNPADYKAYLETFPNGRFVALARVRSAEPAAAPAPAPQVAALPPPRAAPALEPAPREFVVTLSASVREAPDTMSRSVTSVPEGRTVVVAGKVAGQNWYLIEDKGKPLGYVFGDALEPKADVDARRAAAARKAAEEKAQREAAAEAERQRVAAAERQRQQEEAARKAAEEKAKQEAARKAAEEKARQEAERKAAEEKTRQQQQAQAVIRPPLPSGEFRAGRPGTRILLTNAGYLELDSAGDRVVRTVNSLMQPASWYAGCWSVGAELKFDLDAARSLWPLEAGKSARFESSRGQGRWELTFRVVGPAELTTAAGKFSTWQIEVEERSLTDPYHVVFTCWYLPEVGMPIKKTARLVGGTTIFRPWEAAKIETRDRARIAFSAPRPGIEFTTDHAGKFTTAASQGTRIAVTAGAGPMVLALGLYPLAADSPLVAEIEAKLARLWPLEVGKTVQAELADPGGGTRGISISVDRTELVSLFASPLDTYVVTWREKRSSGDLDATHTFWWSPAMSFPIKRKTEVKSGQPPLRSYDLRSVKTAQGN